MTVFFRSNATQPRWTVRYVWPVMEPELDLIPAATTWVAVKRPPSGPYPIPVYRIDAGWRANSPGEREVQVVCSIEETLMDPDRHWREVEYARWLPLLACGAGGGDR